MENLIIAGSYINRIGDRWYVTKDRNWKVRVDGDRDLSFIYGSSDSYRLILDEAYDVRSGRKVWQDSPAVRDMLKIQSNLENLLKNLENA